jgi:signal peptide peptidase SppA
MRLIYLVNGPWAITPPMLDEILAIYGRHLRGDKIDLAALSASTGIPFQHEPKGYTVADGVAVLPVDGVIAKRMNLFTKISGGASSELAGRDFEAALADRSVEAIVLAIDSPGGTIDGTPELADLVYRARGQKPVLAVADGMMASAAYWIGSAADAVYASTEVAVVGSIGVVTRHVDVSAAEAKQGIVSTEIYSGKYKRIASQYGPLSEEGRAYIQESLDHAYSVFVDAVARNRGASVETVLTDMADGRTFQGSQAVAAGLVDGVATLPEVVAMAREIARGRTSSKRAGAARATNEGTMNIETLQQDHPELVAEIAEQARAEALAGVGEQLAAARAEGAEAERARIAEVRAQSLPGHEALIEQLALDGHSTGADAAQAIVAAEREQRAALAARIDGEANPPAGVVAGNAGKQAVARATFDKMANDERRSFLAGGGTVTD